MDQRFRDVEYVTYELPRVPDNRQISLRKGEWDHRRSAWTYVVTLRERTNDYWYAHIVAYGVLIHLVLFAVLTAIIIDPRASLAHHAERIRESWAIFLGVFSSVAAALQYLPQVRPPPLSLSRESSKVRRHIDSPDLAQQARRLAFRTDDVHSVACVCLLLRLFAADQETNLRTAGSAVFVYSLAIRPHVNWTAWITFAISASTSPLSPSRRLNSNAQLDVFKPASSPCVSPGNVDNGV